MRFFVKERMVKPVKPECKFHRSNETCGGLGYIGDYTT